jgi:hypothetical protein
MSEDKEVNHSDQVTKTGLIQKLKELSLAKKIISGVITVLVICFIFFIIVGLSYLVHNEHHKTVEQHRIAKIKNHPDYQSPEQVLIKTVNTVVLNQKTILHNQADMMVMLNNLSHQKPVNMSDKGDQLIQTTIEKNKADQAQFNQTVLKQLQQLQQTLEQIKSQRTQPQVSHRQQNSVDPSSLDNHAFKLTNIMWLNNHPKAVVHSNSSMRDLMLSVGETYESWTLTQIKGQCATFENKNGKNIQCM